MPFGRPSRSSNRPQHAGLGEGPAAGPVAGAGPGAAGPGAVAGPAAATGLGGQDAVPPAAASSQNTLGAVSSSSGRHGSLSAASAGTPGANNPSASPNPAFSSSESFGLPANSSTAAQQPGGPGSPSPPFDPRQRAQDFADHVSRSQSQRYPQVTPAPGQLQYGLASSSVDDLPSVANNIPPPVAQPQLLPPHQAQQILVAIQQQPPPPQSVPPTKKSIRKLIKNTLVGSSSSRGQDPHHHAPHLSFDNTGGLARQPSQRISHPPTIRTGASQVSLDQQPVDWQQQPPLQPSPLQGAGEFTDSYVVQGSGQGVLVQNLQDPQNPLTIRHVAQDADISPYGPDDVGFYQQQQAHPQLQGQGSADLQQQYSQPVFSSQDQQSQYIGHPAGQQRGPHQSVLNTHLGNLQPRNPETVSQLSHESPVTDPDHQPNLPPAATSAAVNLAGQQQDQAGRQTQPAAASPTQQQSMAPGGPPPNRRSQETDKGLRGSSEPSQGPPPGYRQSQQPTPMNPLPPLPAQGGQGGQNPPNYRASSVPDKQFDNNGPDPGRNSPQPSASDRDPSDPDKQFKELLTKYKNVKRLYFDGKAVIDQLNHQVEQLQNAVANQRMSQSRTSLDDNEYITRFNRLNGAINNLAFNIRKEWGTLPSWIDRYVSTDALKTGKQEMTAVGRAVISRWVMEEIFSRSFHPGLEPGLSYDLKEIEQNIRRFSYTMNSQEEFDALTSKVVSWRMATLEGLQSKLNSSESASHRADFTQKATSNLTACLYQHLTDPPPAGVDGSASMIVELAVGIAVNLPMESRDVAITYPLPLDTLQANTMEIEKQGLPPLETRPSDSGDGEGADSRGDEGGGKDGSGDKKDRRGDKSRTTANLPPKDSNKVRFAGFVVVEVRGRQVLVKAPVWTLS